MSIIGNQAKKVDTSFDQGVELETRLRSEYGDLDAPELLEAMIKTEFAGKIAVSSSFGSEAAVLLHLVAEVDPETPVLFINTGQLFEETVAYKETVSKVLGLKNVKVIAPDPIQIEAADRDGTLWQRDVDYCCHLRKVLPFERALENYDAWISGRKRYQGDDRASLPTIELDDDGRIKINPLATWDYEKIMSVFKSLDMPRHPLVEKGYLSIGCAPCTRPVGEGESVRAGRWAGQSKSECGIHKSASVRRSPWI